MIDKKWKNARQLIKLIEFEGSTDRCEYYHFGFKDGVEIPIVIKYEIVEKNGRRFSRGTHIECKCKHCSVTNNQFLCSYKIALTLYKAGIKDVD